MKINEEFPVNHPKSAIILTSGMILFLELALIRFLPAHILYLGFFTNFVLLASFLGIGVGLMLSRFKFNLTIYFPAVLMILMVLARLFSSGINLVNNEIIFFRSSVDVQSFAYPVWLIMPVMFVSVSALFVSLGQFLGRLFIKIGNPITAYIFDITGSILGIVVFFFCSYFHLIPFVWFFILSIIFSLYFIHNRVHLIIGIIVLLIAVNLSLDFDEGTVYWSPYYKITTVSEESNVTNLLTNNIHHQFFSPLSQAPQYKLIFKRLAAKTQLNNVLIIGSGTGQDLNAALQAGAKHIDAVEIDPVILQIGKDQHPERPYSDERVTIYNNDGRNFLRTSHTKYDVIIFALTDSLILNSGFSQVRLESYLFTLNSFKMAKEHLNKKGLFVMYNDYRTDWLIKKLGTMDKIIFGESPQVVNLGGASRMFIARSTDYNFNLEQHGPITLNKMVLPTDDWPFLYLKAPVIPGYYMGVFFGVGLISLISVIIASLLVVKKEKFSKGRLAVFFLLGAAFSLIETKSIVQMNLIFGSTWIVNALAFGGILITVLLACLLNSKWKIKNVYLVTFLLLLSILLQFFVGPQAVIVDSAFLRFVLSIIYFYLPIFFANILFTKFFSESSSVDMEFGANILGLIAGGITEYIALQSGYSSLSLIAGLFYIVALVILKKSNSK